ncbi:MULTISPECIES: hypothetical protein [unclassified Streptomyces]|uniref:hypothetical protein n=1 Tax=unclassified Streptomyces TaxID=2593676 RepID=UPI0006FECDBB|nr:MULTISPECIES: hypothetical protein [unclassified Streptomyces]KQX57969.1 hypothetical protein ASD33_26140 [Streptomyces sp. Root1304]KRA85629.1 hypothetical protein ASE09_33515 [Streptomyces sp. Root66D1]
MSFDEEWAQVRDGSAVRQDSAMRLNSAAASPGGGSGQPDLRTNDPGKAAAVKALETRLQPDTHKAGVVADESTNAAETAFASWATSAGLKSAHEQWAMQVKSLQARLDADKSALQGTRSGFTGFDNGLQQQWLLLQPPAAGGPQGPFVP